MNTSIGWITWHFSGKQDSPPYMSNILPLKVAVTTYHHHHHHGECVSLRSAGHQLGPTAQHILAMKNKNHPTLWVFFYTFASASTNWNLGKGAKFSYNKKNAKFRPLVNKKSWEVSIINPFKNILILGKKTRNFRELHKYPGKTRKTRDIFTSSTSAKARGSRDPAFQVNSFAMMDPNSLLPAAD